MGEITGGLRPWELEDRHRNGRRSVERARAAHRFLEEIEEREAVEDDLNALLDSLRGNDRVVRKRRRCGY